MPGLPPLTPAPTSRCLDEVTVLALQRVLAHVPNVALLVLAYQSKVRSTGTRARRRCRERRCRGLRGSLRLMRHDLVVGLRGRSAHALVVEGRPGYQGPVPVVDRPDEVRRVDLRRYRLNRRQRGSRGGGGTSRVEVLPEEPQPPASAAISAATAMAALPLSRFPRPGRHRTLLSIGRANRTTHFYSGVMKGR